MFSNQFFSSTQEFFTDVFTEFLSFSLKNSSKFSSSLKYIDSQKHLVQYLHHDDSIKKKELQN